MDLTHFEIVHLVDRESNGEAYSHKAGSTTAKSLHGCCARGLAVLGGPLEGGRGSEIEYLPTACPTRAT